MLIQRQTIETIRNIVRHKNKIRCRKTVLILGAYHPLVTLNPHCGHFKHAVSVPGHAGQHVVMCAFSGRRTKPDFYYSYPSMERAEAQKTKWLAGLKEIAAYKAEKSAQLKGGHDFAIGDVLSSCWGYDQTNYTYYQVTKLVGKQSIEICEIKKERVTSEAMAGHCVPVKFNFIGDPMIKRVSSNNSVKIDGHYASKKETIKISGCEIFKPDYFTEYA